MKRSVILMIAAVVFFIGSFFMDNALASLAIAYTGVFYLLGGFIVAAIEDLREDRRD